MSTPYRILVGMLLGVTTLLTLYTLGERGGVGGGWGVEFSCHIYSIHRCRLTSPEARENISEIGTWICAGKKNCLSTV